MIEREIEIDAPIETVFQVIRDFKAYPEFLKTTTAVKERPLKSGLQADFSVRVIKEIAYTLKFEIEAPTSVSWTFVRGDLMKKNDGFWKLEKLAENRTKAHYGIDVEFGWFVPKAIIEKATETQLPETLNAFKDRAEGLYQQNQKSSVGK